MELARASSDVEFFRVAAGCGGGEGGEGELRVAEVVVERRESGGGGRFVVEEVGEEAECGGSGRH